MLEKYPHWMCPVKKTLKNVLNSTPATAWRRLPGVEFKPFFFVFSPDLLDIPEYRWTEWDLKTSFSSAVIPLQNWWVSILPLIYFPNYRTTFNRSRENTEIQHFPNFLKDSIRMKLRSAVDEWYVAVTALPWSILLVSLNDPTFQIFELWSKNGSFERTQSISERRPRFWEKNIFFKNAPINPFMNRFQNGLLIQRGHVTSEISHHLDIDISKFHSTLFRVIGFFRYAPKISLIRPKFFSLFFSSCWFFE